jgi:hypothetical protein
MTTKEKVIRESIKRANKRFLFLEKIQNANPVIDLLTVGQEARKLLEDNKGIDKRTSKEFIEKIESLSKKEKECWKMINRQKKWEKDGNEMAHLNIELQDLKRELYYIENQINS